jgi:two-component system OmpR family response regulator
MEQTTPTPPLKVVLIEDSSLLCQILGDVLEELAGVEVVGKAEDERAAIELLRRQQPDLAIVDLQLRAGSGIGVLRVLSRNPDQFGHPRAVVFSNHGQALVREHCFALGVERFFDKATQMGELLAYVRQTLPS